MISFQIEQASSSIMTAFYATKIWWSTVFLPCSSIVWNHFWKLIFDTNKSHCLQTVWCSNARWKKVTIKVPLTQNVIKIRTPVMTQSNLIMWSNNKNRPTSSENYHLCYPPIFLICHLGGETGLCEVSLEYCWYHASTPLCAWDPWDSFC